MVRSELRPSRADSCRGVYRGMWPVCAASQPALFCSLSCIVYLLLGCPAGRSGKLSGRLLAADRRLPGWPARSKPAVESMKAAE